MYPLFATETSIDTKYLKPFSSADRITTYFAFSTAIRYRYCYTKCFSMEIHQNNDYIYQKLGSVS